MSDKSFLRIYSQPAPESQSPSEKPKAKKMPLTRNYKFVSGKARRKRSLAKLSFSDRLLRNSSIACAVLLGILALGNIDQPWAQKASNGIQQALTMKINLDESIGDLSFVRDIMPESALVFLNISNDSRFARPVSGDISHPWSEVQPWLMFDCPDDSPVYAVQDGTVTAVSPLSDGKNGVLIDHGEGLESVYAYLESASVQPGDAVEKGKQIGIADENLYFEWRSGGKSIDPSKEMGF